MNQQAKILPKYETEKAPVLSASGYIAEALGTLDSEIAGLINRLAPVLSPPTKLNGSSESAQHPPAVSDLTNALTQHARSIEELIRVVREVTERVEL